MALIFCGYYIFIQNKSPIERVTGVLFKLLNHRKLTVLQFPLPPVPISRERIILTAKSLPVLSDQKERRNYCDTASERLIP